jgi:hypothetical protein
MERVPVKGSNHGMVSIIIAVTAEINLLFFFLIR